MRIAIVLPPGFQFPLDHPNSIETVVRTFARASRFREDLIVVCDASDASTGDIATLPVAGACSRRVRTWAAIRALRDWRPDLIELHQHAPTAARIARAMPDVPSLFYRHNHVKEPSTGLQGWRHLTRYRTFDGIVTVSQSARDALIESYPELGPRIHPVPNALDPMPWMGDPSLRDQRIVFAGRAAPEKGLAELCAALPAVLDRYPDWTADLLLAAWETHAEWSAQHLEPLARYSDRVRVHRDQPLSAVQDALRTAAIAVIPSVWVEPFGLAALEAHAAGAAVVSSGTGGLREASGEHALYLDAVTPEAIETAIGDLIAKPDRRHALGAAGQAHMLAHHTVARRVQVLDDLRERLVRQGNGKAVGADTASPSDQNVASTV